MNMQCWTLAAEHGCMERQMFVFNAAKQLSLDIFKVLSPILPFKYKLLLPFWLFWCFLVFTFWFFGFFFFAELLPREEQCRI